MWKVSAPALLVFVAALSLVLARAMRQPAGTIHRPADTMAVWG